MRRQFPLLASACRPPTVTSVLANHSRVARARPFGLPPGLPLTPRGQGRPTFPAVRCCS